MTALIVTNVVLLVLTVVLVVFLVREKNESGFQTRRALDKERQANDALAYSSKVGRENDDLRNRLREQGKAWAARVKKARRK